mgnify:FL=1
MKKRIYLVLETEADEDDKSIRNDIEQELGMATHYFEVCSYSESGFEGLWKSTFEKPPKKEDADENGYVIAIAGQITKSDFVGYPYKCFWNVVAKHPCAYPVWKPVKEV